MRRTPLAGTRLHTGGSRFRAGVRRMTMAIAAGGALLAAVATPGALAAGQEHNHFRDIGTDVDPDFCGTGETITVAFNVLFNEWEAPHKADFKQTVFCETLVPALGIED
jgi:hypothetical protein